MYDIYFGIHFDLYSIHLYVYPWLSLLRGWDSLTMTFGKFGYISSPFYIATTQSQYLILIERDGGLSTLCHSCSFACQQRVLTMFPGPCYLRCEGGIV